MRIIFSESSLELDIRTCIFSEGNIEGSSHMVAAEAVNSDFGTESSDQL